MFSGYHVTRPTRKDDKGKAVAYVAGMTPRDGAQGCKASGKGECVDLFCNKVEMPETITDVMDMLQDPKWLEPKEKVSYGFATLSDASKDGDEIKVEVAPIVALIVNAMKLAKNAEVTAKIAPKGMIKARRLQAELHWSEYDLDSYRASIKAWIADPKAKDVALDKYYADHLAE